MILSSSLAYFCPGEKFGSVPVVPLHFVFGYGQVPGLLCMCRVERSVKREDLPSKFFIPLLSDVYLPTLLCDYYFMPTVVEIGCNDPLRSGIGAGLCAMQ